MESTTNRKGALSIIAGIGLILLAIVLFIQNGMDDVYLLVALTTAYGVFLIVQRKGLAFSVASFAYSGVILGHYAYCIADSIYHYDNLCSILETSGGYLPSYIKRSEIISSISNWETVIAEYKFLLAIGLISLAALLLLQTLRYVGNDRLADTMSTFIWFIPSALYGIYLVLRCPDIDDALIIVFQIVIFFLLGLWLKGTRNRATTNTANSADEWRDE